MGELGRRFSCIVGEFEWEGGEPRRGAALCQRGIRSVVSGEVKKSPAQARKLRSLSNPVKVKAKLAT